MQRIKKRSLFAIGAAVTLVTQLLPILTLGFHSSSEKRSVLMSFMLPVARAEVPSDWQPDIGSMTDGSAGSAGGSCGAGGGGSSSACGSSADAGGGADAGDSGADGSSSSSDSGDGSCC